MGRKRKELPPGFRELFPVMKNRELAVRSLAYGYRWSYVDVALENEEVTTDNQD